MILGTWDTTAKCTYSVISLEYGTLPNKSHAIVIGELYARAMFIPYTMDPLPGTVQKTPPSRLK